MLIFEKSVAGRQASGQFPKGHDCQDIPADLLRGDLPCLPEVSELQAVRHYTRLSQKNFSIDSHFYPLGSCTMKYNPRICHTLAMLPGFLSRHPLSQDNASQGYLHCLYELQAILADVTGMKAISLTGMAGAQGEFAGMAMIRAYHQSRGDEARDEVLVPDAAHGTNPATAIMCGMKVKEIPTNDQGDIDLPALKAAVGAKTAGLMLTNPSTLGVFERQIHDIAQIVHQAGGLLYYDGANLNAILGKVRPGDMGFDVIHLNLHKTFATPHGGGGPGAAAIGVAPCLLPFIPVPQVVKKAEHYSLADENDIPQTIGRLSAFGGNAGVLLRAYVYVRLLGKQGMQRVAEYATLNANYLKARLQTLGFEVAFADRYATHEFIVTVKKQLQQYQVKASDYAKRLLDYGYYAPTVYFPLLVAESLLIEPTETEDKQTLDGFIKAMYLINEEAKQEPALLQNAPTTMPVKRLDDVKAARELNLVWRA